MFRTRTTGMVLVTRVTIPIADIRFEIVDLGNRQIT